MLLLHLKLVFEAHRMVNLLRLDGERLDLHADSLPPHPSMTETIHQVFMLAVQSGL